MENLTKIKHVVLNEKPIKYGFKSDKWTGPLVLQWVKNEFGVEYQVAQIYNLLDKIGITFEKKLGLVGLKTNV